MSSSSRRGRPGRGGFRRNVGRRGGSGGSFGGFYGNDWNDVATVGRPKRARSESPTVGSEGDEIEEAGADEREVTLRRRIDFQSDDPELAVSNALPPLKRTHRAAPEPGRGVGAPIRAVKVSGSRVSMPKRTFKRLMTAKNRVHALETTILELRAMLENGREQFPPKMTRVAACAVLVALGVSESKVPHVLTACATYFGVKLDQEKELVAGTTVGSYVKIVGEGLKLRHAQIFEESPGMLVAVGLDTSTRNGVVASYVFSCQVDGTVFDFFEGFGRMAGSTGSASVDALMEILKVYPTAQLHGVSTDAPATMVGDENGFGALLSSRLERWIRHDLCEKHGAASVLRVLEAVWPAQINVPGVCQLVFLAWYILNSDWDRFRTLMALELLKDRDEMDDDVVKMIDLRLVTSKRSFRDECAFLLQSDLLNKPQKPVSTRWETLSSTLLFVFAFWPLLVVIFDDFRELKGANPPPMSIAVMCAQFVKWCGSVQLRSLLEMAAEFVQIWTDFNSRISHDVDDFDSDVHHRVHQRPGRALFLLMKIEKILQNLKSLPSFSAVQDSFQKEGVAAVVQLYTQLYELALDRVKRNFGRYLSGMYLLGGLADSEFAPIVLEALAGHLGKHDYLNLRTVSGLRLERWLDENPVQGLHRSEFDRATQADGFWDEMLELVLKVEPFEVPALEAGKRVPVLPSAEERRLFANQILSAKLGSFCFILNSWRICQSNTQPVERSFLHMDQANRGGVGKGKATVPSGRKISLLGISARVRTASVLHEAEQTSIKDRGLVRKRAKSAHDVNKMVSTAISTLTPTKEEFTKARADVLKQARPFKVNQQTGVSDWAMAELVRENGQYALGNVQYVRKLKDELTKEGRLLQIPIQCTCYSDERCKQKEKQSKKGSKGDMLTCECCLRKYHRKCLLGEGEVGKKPGKKGNPVVEAFTCKACANRDSSAFNEMSEEEGEENEDST